MLDARQLIFADRSMELISYHAINASCQLAKERGLRSVLTVHCGAQGIIPIDSIQLIKRFDRWLLRARYDIYHGLG